LHSLATHCITLQHPATHRNTPQHTAAHCNTLIDDVYIIRSCDAIVALATAATAAARDTWKNAVEEAYGESVAEFQEGIASLRPLFMQRYILMHISIPFIFRSCVIDLEIDFMSSGISVLQYVFPGF